MPLLKYYMPAPFSALWMKMRFWKIQPVWQNQCWMDLIKIFCFELSAYFGQDWKLWLASHPMKWTSSPLIVVMIWMLLKKGGLHLTKDELPRSFTISSLLTCGSFKLEGKSPNLPFTPAAASAKKIGTILKRKGYFHFDCIKIFSADHELVEYCDNDAIMCQNNHVIDRLIFVFHH